MKNNTLCEKCGRPIIHQLTSDNKWKIKDLTSGKDHWRTCITSGSNKFKESDLILYIFPKSVGIFKIEKIKEDCAEYEVTNMKAFSLQRLNILLADKYGVKLTKLGEILYL